MSYCRKYIDSLIRSEYSTYHFVSVISISTWIALLSIEYGMKAGKSGFVPTATHQALQVHNVILTPGDR